MFLCKCTASKKYQLLKSVLGVNNLNLGGGVSTKASLERVLVGQGRYNFKDSGPDPTQAVPGEACACSITMIIIIYTQSTKLLDCGDFLF